MSAPPAELEAEKLFNIVHDGCNLPPRLDLKLEKRISKCVTNLVLGGHHIPTVEAFIADWRQNKTIALTPERLASDIGEWKRLHWKSPAAVSVELPPRPDTTGLTGQQINKAMLAWHQQCQQIKQQTTGV